MRVIAGKAKGRKLRSVPGPGTRPITDRAKSALFSIIGGDIAEARFLDLFAGTGQVGIEALSRGAREVVFVEKGHRPMRTIRTNLEETGLGEEARLVQADVFRYLLTPPQVGFDYIYIAPPQYRGLWKRALEMVDARPRWLAEDGWVIVQIHPREFEPLNLQHLRLFDQRRYGGVLLLFFSIGEGDDEESGAF